MFSPFELKNRKKMTNKPVTRNIQIWSD